MDILADILLGLGALGAAVYCLVLSRRLRRFNNLQNGMGGAVAVLSAQVDDMTKTLDKARLAAGESAAVLGDLTERAESSARNLELMMASLHDIPDHTENHDASSDSQAQNHQEDAPPLFSSNRVLEAAE
ncbi:hypothetical protein [uncultured Aliiroseovarius sp.]|uniref:hypothetical protein n=1 Tax=uncultured Aliiroseovarius sp. TaxID=1658783 RepID=UPI0026171E30|nr:hypothetical protein [uncultured Aliiroseovarius sp.]